MSVAIEFATAAPVPARARPNRHLRAVSPEDSAAPPTCLPAVAVLRPPAASATMAPLRLTTRGVLVCALVVAALAAVLMWVAWVSGPGVEVASTGAPQVPATVTVRAGDTLWAIAGRVAPNRDSRAEVATLLQLNDLHDVEVFPGQRLRVR